MLYKLYLIYYLGCCQAIARLFHTVTELYVLRSVYHGISKNDALVKLKHIINYLFLPKLNKKMNI